MKQNAFCSCLWHERPWLCRFCKGGWKIVGFLLAVGLLFLCTVLCISAAVCDKTEDRILTPHELSRMEGEFDCILVLGCRVYSDGTPSDMLYDRITTGVSLYRAGVADKLLMSGDSQHPSYDEIGAMVRVADEQGIPTEAILTDPMGLSTYESILRLRDAFHGRRVVIVTQEYHLHRALYLAEKLGLDAYGVRADLRPYQKQLQMELREILARCKDVYYGLKQPPPPWM